MRPEPSLFCVGLLAAICGCTSGANGGPVTATHDKPAAANLARAELEVVVSLEPAANCEETFDLALYKDETVERIAWDDQKGKCAARRVVIRYLSGARKEADLIAKLEKLTRSVEAHRGGEK
jgi:hypothetical protein